MSEGSLSSTYTIQGKHKQFYIYNCVMSNRNSNCALITSVLTHEHDSDEHRNMFSSNMINNRIAKQMHNAINQGNLHSVHSIWLAKASVNHANFKCQNHLISQISISNQSYLSSLLVLQQKLLLKPAIVWRLLFRFLNQF